MSVDDKLINVRVDQIFVRRGVDTTKLNYSTAKGSVTIIGFLKGRSKTAEPKSNTDMKQIDYMIRKIPNVKGVVWNLQNWRKDGATWKKIMSAKEQFGEGG